MNCEDYDILLSARLDGELTRQEEADLEAHLAQCPRCRRQAQALEELHWQTLSLTNQVPGRLKSWLADQDWAALPQDSPAETPGEDTAAAGEILPLSAELPAASPDAPVVLAPIQSNGPQKNRRRRLPWLLCGAAAAVLLAVGLFQVLLPNSVGGGFSQAMMEVFHREETILSDRDDAAQEDTVPPNADANADAQDEREQEESQKTDETENQDPFDTRPNTPGDNHAKPPNQDPQEEAGNASNPGSQDTPGTDPGQEDPSQGEDPNEPTEPPSNGLTQQQAQDLLTAHLAAQGRSLSLLPLGSSGGMWRFSGKDDTGRVVSFFMVNQTSGEIQEVPVPPPEEGPTVGPGGLS